MTATLRHPTGPSRAPVRGKPVQRGASRMVAQEPLGWRVSMPKANFAWLRHLTWPLLLVGLAYGSYELALKALPYADQPIARISVEGDLSYVNQQAVQQLIAPYAAASFFGADLLSLRRELEHMPWIANAQVRRVWPDQLVVRLEEQLPIARWGDEALLNNQGDAFAPQELANYQHLPQLYGPMRAQQRVMQQYQMLSQMLRPMGFSIARLELRERGSWFLSTSQGIELLLGRDHLVEKIRRFSAIYDKALKEQQANIARIDLRYSNGLAVAWREPIAPAAPNSVVVQ